MQNTHLSGILKKCGSKNCKEIEHKLQYYFWYVYTYDIIMNKWIFKRKNYQIQIFNFWSIVLLQAASMSSKMTAVKINLFTFYLENVIVLFQSLQLK